MLEAILDKKTCADCRFCCVFDATDIWEMPLALRPLNRGGSGRGDVPAFPLETGSGTWCNQRRFCV
jgi:hypothetical protein